MIHTSFSLTLTFDLNVEVAAKEGLSLQQPIKHINEVALLL